MSLMPSCMTTRVFLGASALLSLCSCSARMEPPKSLEDLYEVQMQMLVDPELPEQDRSSIMGALERCEERALWPVLIEHWDDMRIVDPEYSGDHNLAPNDTYVLTLGQFCSDLFFQRTGGINGYSTKEEMREWWARSKDLPIQEIRRQRNLELTKARWSDRWFLMSMDGKTVGWRHQTAKRWPKEGPAGWTITEECENEIGEASHTHYICKIECLDDENLSPGRMEWSISQTDKDGVKEYSQEVDLYHDFFVVKVRSGFNSGLALGERQVKEFPLDRSADSPLACSILAPLLAEIQAAMEIRTVSRRYFSQEDPQLTTECTTILEEEREMIDKRDCRVVQDNRGHDVDRFTIETYLGLISRSTYDLTLKLSDAEAAAQIQWRFKPEPRDGK